MQCEVCGTQTDLELCEACEEILREPTQAEVEQLLAELEEVLED